MKLNKLFILLSIGLTFLSLAAGFNLYLSMFGLFMACVISGIFETLRLATLYSISKFDGFYRSLSLILYAMTAFVCFSAGAISFNSNVIEKSEGRHLEIAKSQSNDIFLIKNEYSRRIDEQINLVEKSKSKNEILSKRTL